MSIPAHSIQFLDNLRNKHTFNKHVTHVVTTLDKAQAENKTHLVGSASHVLLQSIINSHEFHLLPQAVESVPQLSFFPMEFTHIFHKAKTLAHTKDFHPLRSLRTALENPQVAKALSHGLCVKTSLKLVSDISDPHAKEAYAKVVGTIFKANQLNPTSIIIEHLPSNKKPSLLHRFIKPKPEEMHELLAYFPVEGYKAWGLPESTASTLKSRFGYGVHPTKSPLR